MSPKQIENRAEAVLRSCETWQQFQMAQRYINLLRKNNRCNVNNLNYLAGYHLHRIQTDQKEDKWAKGW